MSGDRYADRANLIAQSVASALLQKGLFGAVAQHVFNDKQTSVYITRIGDDLWSVRVSQWTDDEAEEDPYRDRKDEMEWSDDDD